MRPCRQKGIRPHVVAIGGPSTTARPVGAPQPPALGLLLGDFQPFPPPQPLHALVIYRPALPTQQPRNPPIALPPRLRRQRDDPGHQPWLIIRPPRPMPVGRPRLPQHSACPPLRHAQPVADQGHRLPASRRAQKFPEATSLRIDLSNAWSATNFFSRVSSRSSSSSACRSLLTICSVLYRFVGILPPPFVHDPNARYWTGFRGGAGHDPTTRATDTKVQVSLARATILVGAWTRPESLLGLASPAPSGAPPFAENALVPRVG